MKKFPLKKNFKNLQLPDAEVYLFQNFFSKAEATVYFQQLKENIDWQQDKIKIYGKEYLQPRLTAFFAKNSANYTYSGITMTPSNFIEPLQEIKRKVEKEINLTFTSCLANLYRSGQDSNSWHSDDEKELGVHPVIASVSFGAGRMFHFKHKKNPELKFKLELEPGSLLIMKGATQENYKHQVPKTKKPVDARINLTFRRINP